MLQVLSGLFFKNCTVLHIHCSQYVTYILLLNSKFTITIGQYIITVVEMYITISIWKFLLSFFTVKLKLMLKLIFAVLVAYMYLYVATTKVHITLNITFIYTKHNLNDKLHEHFYQHINIFFMNIYVHLHSIRIEILQYEMLRTVRKYH